MAKNCSLTSDVNVTGPPEWLDLPFFISVEVLGLIGSIGNVGLLFAIVKWNHCRYPSYVIMASLATADIYHGLHTSFYFYPPIILGDSWIDLYDKWWLVAVFNGLDWCAWGITLTHMAALTVDRYIAIVHYQWYKHWVTRQRVLRFAILAWVLEAVLALSLVASRACCPMVPIKGKLTFDYMNDTKWAVMAGSNDNATYYAADRNKMALINVYRRAYIPQEVIAMIVLMVLNPLSLISLYRRGKKINNRDKHTSVTTRENRKFQRDVKVYLQIGTILVLFFAYMAAYYLTSNVPEWVRALSSKSVRDCWFNWTGHWTVASLNSLLYTLNNTINPLIYLLVNNTLRLHFLNTITFGWVKVPFSRRRGSSYSQSSFALSSAKTKGRTETIVSVSSF